MIEAGAQLTAIEISTGGVTESVKLLEARAVDDTQLFALAEMLVEPGAIPVARPPMMVATPVFDELQLTWLVISLVDVMDEGQVAVQVVAPLKPLYVPVAVHWDVLPMGREAFGHVTAIDLSVGTASIWT